MAFAMAAAHPADMRYSTNRLPNLAHQANGYTTTSSQGKPQFLTLSQLTEEQQNALLFGPNTISSPANPYLNTFTTTRVVSDTFGVGQHMGNVILTLITEAHMALTDVVLPWESFTGSPDIRVSTMEFADRPLDHVPEKGTIRYQTFRNNTTTSTVDRKGLGFEMEQGYARTPEGIRDYMYHMAQMRNTVLQHAAQLVLEALLTAGPVAGDWWERMAIRYPEATLDRIFDQECLLWGVLNKSQYGFASMVAMAKDVLSRRGKHFDTLIMPFNTGKVYNSTHLEEFEYNKMGPEGPQRRESEGGAIAAQSQFLVLESVQMPMNGDSAPRDPLVRNRRSHGEFGLMGPPRRLDPSVSFNPASADKRILNCDTDSMARISYEEAVEATGLFKSDGNLSVLGVQFFAGHPTLADLYTNVGLENYAIARMASMLKPGKDAVTAAVLAAGGGPRVGGRYTFGRRDRDDLVATLTRSESLRLEAASRSLPLVNCLVPDLLFSVRQANSTLDEPELAALLAKLKVNEAAIQTLATKYKITTESLSNLSPSTSTDTDLESKLALAGFEQTDASEVTKQRKRILILASNPADFRAYNASVDPTDTTKVDSEVLWDAFKKCRTASITRALVKAFWSVGLYFPINVIWARPHMTWEMGSCIAMLRGPATGVTMIGNVDFSTFQSSRKVLEGNLTLNMGPIIKTPSNIYVLHNAVCKGYVGGGGVKFFDPLDSVQVQRYNEGINDADIFCLAVPYGWIPLKKHMDLTGEYPRDLVESNASANGQYTPLHYPSARVYAQHYGWAHRSDRVHLDIDFQEGGVALNTRVFQATQFDMDVNGNDTNTMTTGSGHWGSRVYGGVVSDRVSAVGGRCVQQVYDHTSVHGVVSR